MFKIYPGDKSIQITDMDSANGLSITIDYDDVDHETVLRDTDELIRRVNSFNLLQK
jgi:hypothetical protein